MEGAAQEKESAVNALPVSRRTLLLASGASLGVAALGWSALLPATPALAVGTYLRPCGNIRVSDTWQDHKNRNPPSGEPGTDYPVAVGTAIVAATNGVIVDRKDSTTTATGRYIALRTDDGNYIRYLHLRSSTVPAGVRVVRGQTIASSGSSAFGSENGADAHVHVSLWAGGTPQEQGFKNSVDFERFAESIPVKPNPEDPVPIHQSTSFTWNTAIPANRWTPIRVEAGQMYVVYAGARAQETGELVINVKASGVTAGLQIRVVAEALSSAGTVIRSHPQPVVEIPRTGAAGASTFGQYVMPYRVTGPVRMFVHGRALNAGVVIEEIIVKKNYWAS